MEAKREQAAVGIFVIIAAALLIATVFALTGAFGTSGLIYHTYVKFAAGLAPGTIVRYGGGPQSGRVEHVRVDPNNSSRLEITFSVSPDTPVKTDSVVKISSLSPLGDSFLEVDPGTQRAPLAPTGSELKAADYASFDDVKDMLNELGPQAKDLLKNLNARVTELQETITRVNDLLNQRNRENIAASMANVRGMLEEDRPKIKSVLGHMDTASAKLSPMIDDLKKTMAKANSAIDHLDATLEENRPDLHKSITEMRDALASAQTLLDQLNRTLDANSENLDEIIENVRHISENMKEFTETIKTHPNTLIRSSGPPSRKPGGDKKQ